MQKRVTIHYEGTVQGVGFRFTAREVATGYDIIGAVRNLPDGRVELVAEGEESEVKAYLEGIQETHLRGLIRGQQAVWAEPQGNLKGFRILHGEQF